MTDDFFIPDKSSPKKGQLSTDDFFIPDSKEQKSVGIPGQAALGAASYFTWPTDLAQATIRSGAQDVLKEMGEDTPEARAAIEESVSKIPTQQIAEDYLSKKTGYRLKPEGFAEETARTAGQLISPKGLLTGGIKQIAKTTAKRGAAAVAGASAQKGLEKVGVSPFIASLVGITGASAADIGTKFSKEAKEIKDLAQKHGLRESQFMVEGKGTIPRIITTKKAEKISKELGETSKEAIQNIIKSKNPLAKLRSEGVNVEEYANKILKDTEEIAKKSTRPVSMDPIIKDIDKKISEVKATAPSLSDTDKKFIDILEEKKNDFEKSPSINLEQYLNQYRKNNSDRKAFYKNPQMTHLQEAANSAYGFLNESMVKNAELGAEKEFATSLKAGNKLHSERSNLLQTESIFAPFFDDPSSKNLDKILKNEKKSAFLKRNIGEEGMKEIKEIGKYTSSAQDKLKSNFIQHGESWIGVVRDLGIASFASLLSPDLSHLLELGLASSYVRGAMMSNKVIRGNGLNLYKAMSSGNEKAIRIYSQKFNRDFEKRYGNPEDMIAEE